ncbi:putative F-box/FBD/LRR-repeat protein At4g03220 [Daucus carota subsp. sativus]|uniref:putative F-box/FBD/LRR-repeat protein At4g03220 n=1 Tax=Daucus carota subsp. sativus TaxID=79200 RepID=UPI0007EF8290|nr:PREDICTED: putative F-box/FBD/LRR-repeat protein At4g03220 [Daucus carota subsp. sativus]
MNGQSEKKKKKARITSEDGEDRISKLPDELLHRILKFVDTKFSVQTSALSKRWKLVWTTLPFLNFKWDQRSSAATASNLARQVFTRRNHGVQISCLELKLLPYSLMVKFIEYAISHHVQCLIVHFRSDHKPYKLSNFNSDSIQKLELEIKPEDSLLESDCWDLPVLSTLRLKSLTYSYYISDNRFYKLEKQYLTCLPALRDLSLEKWDLHSLFSFIDLTTLILRRCKLPKVWNLPALTSLTLDDVKFPENMKDLFAALVNLRNLKLTYDDVSVQNCFVHCPELVNLEIKTRYCSYKAVPDSTVVVFAPKLSNFTSVGIFRIMFEVSKLDYANVKLHGWIDDKNFYWEKSKETYQQFTIMLPALGSAKILNLDLEAIEALQSIFDFLLSFPSPFYDLKFVKLPRGCNEANISSTLRSYLLGGSPTATIVTAQDIAPYTEAATVKAQNVVLQEPLGPPTRVLVDSQYIHKTACVETADLGVLEELVEQNSLLDVERVRQISAPVERTGNDQVRSSRDDSDFALWQGHEVNCEFVCLLDLIMDKYPETFEHFTTKNKKFCTIKLNTLCTSVNDFTKISMTDVDTEMISEYRDVFAELQKFGFNVSWLVSRLNYIEQVRFSQPLFSELHAIDSHIVDTKSKLQEYKTLFDDTITKLKDLETLRAEKMKEIQKAFGPAVTNLVVGCIGDDLLSSP